MRSVPCACGLTLLVPPSWTVWRCARCHRTMALAVTGREANVTPTASDTVFVVCAAPGCRREALGRYCRKHEGWPRARTFHKVRRQDVGVRIGAQE